MRHIFLVGVKGTGMASLAVLLSRRGYVVEGCDVAEVFTTDALLAGASVPVKVGFDPALLPGDADTVVYSSAYDPGLPILNAARNAGMEVLDYNRMLARMTRRVPSYAVCGTHGKTTCTAMTAWALLQRGGGDLPFHAVFGSALRGMSGMPDTGDGAFLLEGCEYRDHFLSYAVRGALVTNIEWDHPDYFPTETAYVESFHRFLGCIAPGGTLIVCVDGRHAADLYADAKEHRRDLTVVSYGCTSRGPYRISQDAYGLSLDGLQDRFPVPGWGPEWACDLVGASLLAATMTGDVAPDRVGAFLRLLAGYPGTVGRLEPVADEDGVLYFDDYAHHPTQVAMVIRSLCAKYPGRPVFVLFMPHTASRTRALFDGFVKSLSLADKVVVQRTFASARGDGDEGEDSALLLERALERRLFGRMHGRLGAVAYAASDAEAVSLASSWLMEGDILVTMGAGNNRKLSRYIIAQRKHDA